jgi:hypothetical protein
MVELGMVTDRREEVQNLAVIGSCVANAIGSNYRKPRGPGNANCLLISPFLLAFIMALHFDIHVVMAKDPDQPLDNLPACFFASCSERRG